MNEIIFEVTEDSDGGVGPECLTESIFTQAGSWEKLKNVKEGVAAYYFDRPGPDRIRLHLIRDELLVLG